MPDVVLTTRRSGYTRRWKGPTRKKFGFPFAPTGAWLPRTGTSVSNVGMRVTVIDQSNAGGIGAARVVGLRVGVKYEVSVYVYRVSGALSQPAILRVNTTKELAQESPDLSVNYGTTRTIQDTRQFTATSANQFIGMVFPSMAGQMQVYDIQLSLREVL